MKGCEHLGPGLGNIGVILLFFVVVVVGVKLILSTNLKFRFLRVIIE